MKMENIYPVTGSLNSTVANEPIKTSAHFPLFKDDLNLDYFESLANLDQNDLRKLFSHPEYPLCRNSSYQHLPLCQGNISLDEPYGHSNEEFQYAFIVELVVPIIFGIVVILGVFGNALVVLVIIINKQMRSTTNYLIFSLAIADLLFTLFCVPFTASDYIFSKWPFGSVWCKVVQYLTYVTAYASVYTLLLLSIDRYLAVVHPIYAISIRTEKNAIYAIVCTWTLILSSCVPLYIVHGVSENETCKFNEDEYHHAAFHIGFITTMYFIPLTVIVGLYLMILQRLWSQSAPGGTRSAESVRGKKRVTRMVVIVIVTFIICWLPIQIVLLLKSLGKYEMTTSRIFIQIFGQALAYMNSCVNPILYAFLSDPFRKAFRKVMSCGDQRKSQNGRLTYEGTTQTRQVTQRQQSIALATLPDSLCLPASRGNNNSTGSERKLIEHGDHHYSKLCMNTTTTSFGNGSTKGDDSPTPSCQSNLNGIV